MTNTKPTQSKETCIRCGKADRVIRRGLCQAHYGEFRTAKSQVSDSELEVWEACLVAKGLILPDARKAVNPYINTLAELRARGNVLSASEMENPDQEAVDADRSEQVKRAHRQVETRKVAEDKSDYDSEKKPSRRKKSG